VLGSRGTGESPFESHDPDATSPVPELVGVPVIVAVHGPVATPKMLSGEDADEDRFSGPWASAAENPINGLTDAVRPSAALNALNAFGVDVGVRSA